MNWPRSQPAARGGSMRRVREREREEKFSAIKNVIFRTQIYNL